MTGEAQKTTGCLYEKNGIWQMRIFYYEGETKKRKDKSTKLSVKGNKKRAQQMLEEFINEFPCKNGSVENVTTFYDFMLLWLESYKNSLELNTYESYKDIISRYLKDQPEADICLTAVTPLNIQTLYNRHIQKGLSANTVLKLHANVRKALHYAYSFDLIPSNPAAKVMLPKKKRFTAGFYDETQIKMLLELTIEEPMYPAIVLAAHYGLRRSEILGLKWNSVDFQNKTFIIKDTVTLYHTIVDKEQTKTKSSYRTLPLTNEMALFLKQLKSKQNAERELLGRGYQVNDYVCKRADGTPFLPDYLTCRFRQIIRKYKLPRIRFHDLRHSAASLLLANGFSLKEIQEYLGHGDIATTSNIYGHLLFKAKEAMANKMEQALKINA